jgi:hypothetical protein
VCCKLVWAAVWACEPARAPFYSFQPVVFVAVPPFGGLTNKDQLFEMCPLVYAYFCTVRQLTYNTSTCAWVGILDRSSSLLAY